LTDPDRERPDTDPPHDVPVTALVQSWRKGSAQAASLLQQQVYAMLRKMAAQRLGGRGPATLQPTALVNEAVARLLDGDTDFASRAHFFALAALQMRAVLVEHHRRAVADKRGGGAVAVELDPDALVASDEAERFLDLHRALDALAADDARTARAIELSYFGGLSAREIATVLEVSDTTVERDLAFGKRWLRRRLEDASDA
jgi:RNA polymerase sigma factor (TIGR02999 family)